MISLLYVCSAARHLLPLWVEQNHRVFAPDVFCTQNV
ncbi:hypothetical protein JYU34_004382 [Plutella xylostella]|uniref:Uncharacterized protein n=1 Tax=Plutella xylostella TaxID=51655 RepID=A0ABQ7QXY8_PLUXY|nr:hypothetical protein JYU34_004382 [Plutella xylostella]